MDGYLTQMINMNLLIAVVGCVEFLKIYIPDNVETKFIPVIALVLCVALSQIPVFGCSLIQGVFTGICAPGLYAAAFKMIEKFSGKGE